MVQIVVEIECESKEWVLIELQGDLECNPGKSIKGKPFGELFFLSKERPILIIGYLILYGKVVENNPGIAVLRKNKDSTIKDTSSMPTGKSTTYSLLAIVKKRIVFRTRPKPIITYE